MALTKFKTSFLAFGMGLFLNGAAQNNLPAHEQRLREIQEKVQLSLGVGMNYFEQVDAVTKLHELVFHSSISQHFGPQELIQQVIVRKPYAKDNPHPEAAFLARLRNHLFQFTSTGLSGEYLVKSINEERILVSEIKMLEAQLLNSFPNLQLSRQGDAVTGVTSTNVSYLKGLRSLFYALTSRDLQGSLNQFKTIRMVDSGDHVGGIKFERIKYRGSKVGQLDDLNIRVSQTWSYMSEIPYYPEMIAHALNIVVSLGFQSLDSQLLEQEETPAAIRSLAAKLTPEVAERLKVLGVTSIAFSSTWRSNDSLIRHGVLTLGPSDSDIQYVIDYLLGQN